jgi:hypothetical protein
VSTRTWMAFIAILNGLLILLAVINMIMDIVRYDSFTHPASILFMIIVIVAVKTYTGWSLYKNGQIQLWFFLMLVPILSILVLVSIFFAVQFFTHLLGPRLN